MSRDVHNDGELKRIVYNAMQDGGAAVAQGPSLDAEFPQYESEFNDFMEEFISWSKESWWDKDAVKSDKITNSNESPDTDVMATYNKKEDAYYIHILSTSKSREITVNDSVKFLGKATDIKTGKEIPYTQKNGTLTFQIDDWSTYDAYGDMIIKLENKSDQIGAKEVADYISRTYEANVDGFWLNQPESVEGFETEISYSSQEELIDFDGFLKWPEKETTVDIRFKVTNQKDLSDTAQTDKISITVGGSTVIQKKVPQSQMTATATSVYAGLNDTYGTPNAIDGNINTIWHSGDEPLPQSITLDLGGEYTISKVTHLPRTDMRNVDILEYKLYLSIDGTSFEEVAHGEWEKGAEEKEIQLAMPQKATHIKLEILKAGTDGRYGATSELNVFYDTERPIMTKEMLQEAIQNAEAIDSAEYYTKGVLELQKEIEKAKEIVAQEQQTAKEMVVAMESINEKIDELQKVAENIALGQTTNVDESYSNTFTGAEAVDGDMHTRWATSGEENIHYLEVNFPEKKTVNKLVLKALAGTEYPVKVKAEPFKISYKNDAGEWVECFDSTNEVYTSDGRYDVEVPQITEENLQEYIENWPYTGCVHVNKDTGEVLHTLITARFDSVTTDALRYELLEPKAVSLIEFEVYSSVDKSKLQEVWDLYKDVTNDNYTEESWNIFVKECEIVKLLLEDGYNPTQQEMDDAINGLESAFAQLEKEVVSKKTLEYFLNKAKEHVANGDVNDCAEAVKQLFEEAIQEGEAVLADENATKEEVQNATKKLIKAIHALNMKADKTDLEMAIELAKGMELTKYVEEGRAEFQKVLEEAQKVCDDPKALQNEIDAAWNALVETMENLRLKADKSILEDLLNSIKDLDLSKYTEESVAVFKEALAKANEIMADQTLSEDDQKVVDDVVKALKDAKNKLVAKVDNTTDDNNNNNKNNSDNNGGITSGKNDSGNKAAKTGDNTSVLFLVVLLLIAGGTVTDTFRRKRNAGF